MAKFGEICRMIADGDWIESKDQSDEGIRLIQTGNIGNGQYLDKPEKAKYITLETFNRLQCKSVLPGDILISRLPDPVGRACEVPQNIGQAITAVDCTIVRLNSSICNDRYFLNYTQSQRYFHELQTYLAGTTRTRISRKNLEKIEVPLPSLDEQRHIAAVLDKVTDLIAQRRAQLDKLDLLVKSRFVEMFGAPIRNERNWPMVEIGDIAEIRIGPFGSLLHKEDYIKGGHALVNPSHIIDSQICVDENLTVSDEKYAELEPYHLKINDIVLGRRGEMGRCAVVHEEGLLCGTGSLIIRPKKEMKPYFLQSIISNPAYKKIIEDKSVGVTMMNLNVPIVSKLTVPKLPLPLQEQFIGILEKVNELKQPLTNSLQEQEILKNSLMQKYFE
ncbi:restriction endonuclease subunit S [uncultured Subdoligranulum sp.]|uniref:restriction endonuclease subunit S n=1 Tax=uncultured Subdoligranulum sp. TaxID=512298 RepID=UPI0025DD8919|nr:restriction endonuclease subunit S [uncultured Subdoligranulum sp.]